MKQNELQILIAMLEDIKQKVVMPNAGNPKYNKAETLAEALESSNARIKEVILELEKLIIEVRKPVVKETRFTIDIVSKGTFFLILGMMVAILVLSMVVMLMA